MPGSVIGKSLNLGFPGKISRNADNVIRARMVKSIISGSETQPNIPFGAPVKLNSDNTYSLFTATGTGIAEAKAEKFAGIAIAEVKQAVSYGSNQNGAYTPLQPCDVLELGAVMVKCNVGSPTSGGKVYIRVAANEAIPSGVIGGFEAAADGTNTIELTNVQWATDKIDANNMAEVTILTRNRP